jgi:A/G-specific adenine glycosylase
MVSPSPLPILPLRRSLLQWYENQGRQLPWRQTADPYAIWVSEIMLQQTQVKTVIPYYQCWLQIFPTVADLAQADRQKVLKAWEGLGYYARARNLHKAAQKIVQEYQGQFPKSLTEVLSLPGIGRSTAGGILSAAFDQPLAILDGNVKRVLARLIALPIPPQDALSELWALSDALIDPLRGRDFNQAIMDLGATLCTRSQPRCQDCPWQSHCQAYNKGIQTQLPKRKMSAPLPHKRIGVAVITNDQNQILIDRRPETGLLGGLWEFPGGKIEPNETVEACIQREILEEIGIEIAVGKSLITVDHAYTHFRVTLYVHLCQYVSGSPQAIECEEIRWVSLAEIDQFPFPKANSQIIEALKNLSAASP